MNKKMIHLLVIGMVAVSTYLMRFLPIVFRNRIKLDKFAEFLSNSSIAIISALFITSFMSSTTGFLDLPVAIFTLCSVFIFYKLWRNLGLSILIGVLIHFLLSLIFPNL